MIYLEDWPLETQLRSPFYPFVVESGYIGLPVQKAGLGETSKTSLKHAFLNDI